MKHAVNFRLSNQTITTLSILEEKLHTSRTAIIESAIQVYAKNKMVNKNPLLEYAGILGEKHADHMLHMIKTGKHNKILKIDL